MLRYDITGYILKSLGGPWYVSLLSLLLKCINLHTDSNRSTEIREPKIGVARTEFLEKKKKDLNVGF
jgi:hypothetical protein